MATRDDAEVREFVQGVEMGDWDGEPLECETDKAWDAIHRCLSDGTLGCGRRLSPLDMAVLGGGHHHEGEDYIVTHLRADEVTQVAAVKACPGCPHPGAGHLVVAGHLGVLHVDEQRRVRGHPAQRHRLQQGGIVGDRAAGDPGRGYDRGMRNLLDRDGVCLLSVGAGQAR